MTNYWCELALIDGRAEPSVAIEVVDGRFGAVVVGAEPSPDSIRLAGLTLPWPRERAQPCVPSGTAIADPSRSRHVLDVA